MELKRTPGPWETSRDAVPPGHVQITVYAESRSSGERVATVFENEADAHLIAAAPDLLEALQSVLRLQYTLCQPMRTVSIPREMYRELEAVVAKAEGNQ